MALWLLPPLLLVAAVAVVAIMHPALRRTIGMSGARGGRSTTHNPEPNAEAPIRGSAPEADPEALTGVPSRTAGDGALEPEHVFEQLRSLQLELTTQTLTPVELDRQVAAVLAAIGDPTTNRRHFPRRPNLLPQLMHAIHDETVARRRLVGIIASDPALVDSLLRMANSPFYRINTQPIESIERAVTILGSNGLRSVIAAALMQPIFNTAATTDFPRFAQLVWEHALRSAQAAVVHAAVAERTEPFTAELLSLISGLAEIVLFRAGHEHCVAVGHGRSTTAAVIAALLNTQAGILAQRIGTDWQLSESALAALAEQRDPALPSSALSRSLRFGRVVGALAVLHATDQIDETTVQLSLPPTALSETHTHALLAKLLQPFRDPRTGASRAQRH